MFSVNRSFLTRRITAASHFVTWQLGRRCSKSVPLVYVVGYPKSGTTWACQIAASYLQLPFPRYSVLPVTFPAVVHGHELLDPRFPHSIYVMRDGRDVMTSLYYHLQRALRSGARRRIPKAEHSIYAEGIDQESVRRNFPRFLETQIKHTFGCRRSWAEHISSYLDHKHPRLPCLKYEELLLDGASALAREMAKLDGNEPNIERAEFIMADHSFARRAGRKPNQEDKTSFLRKGVIGDWRNYFNRESAEIFNHHCGDALIAAGYAPNRCWADNLGSPSAATPTQPSMRRSREPLEMTVR